MSSKVCGPFIMKPMSEVETMVCNCMQLPIQILKSGIKKEDMLAARLCLFQDNEGSLYQIEYPVGWELWYSI